jgi:hypothetical protein
MPLTRLKLTAIADGGITTDELADDAVTNAKINDFAVGTANLIGGSVTSAKLDTNIAIDGTLDVTGGNVTVGPQANPRIYLKDNDNTRDETNLVANMQGIDSAGDVAFSVGRESGGLYARLRSYASSASIEADHTNTHTDSHVAVRVDNSEIARFIPSGLSFDGASASSSTALDDYETGTFTISLQAGGSDWYGPITHQYVKIGRAVFIMGNTSGSLTGVTSATGAITVKSGTTLPFVPNHWGTISWVGNMRGIDATDVQQGPHLRFGPGSASNISIGTQDGEYSGSGAWTTGYSVNSDTTQTAHYSFFQGVYYTDS